MIWCDEGEEGEIVIVIYMYYVFHVGYLKESGRHSDLTVSARNSEVSSLGSRPGRGH